MEGNMDLTAKLSPLTALPTEVFLHICSFLQVRDLVLNLSKVCRRFHEILNDENVWMSLIKSRWNSSYPIVPVDIKHFDWRGACLDIEKEWRLWKCKEETVNYVIVNDVHISSVDAVVFINSGSTCISGSRDRSIVIWNPLQKVGTFPKYFQKDAAHHGWIWRLLCTENTLYSCSWDSTVKSWSLSTADLQQKDIFKCASSVLSMTLLDGLVLAGDVARTVSAFDPRCKPEPLFSYVAHRRAVLTLGSNSTDVISGSEDRTLAVWDSRTRSVKQKLSLGKTRFPSCSNFNENTLYVGDSKGAVHIFSPKQGNLKLITSLNMGYQKPISVIKHGRGYILTGSMDGMVKIALPTRPPRVMTCIRANRGQVGGLDYCDGALAVGAACCVEFWLPKEHVQY